MKSGAAIKSKQRAERHGRMAEYLVALYYMLRGYRLIARRYRCRSGEIDLIMGRGAKRLFIEVKYRASSHDNIETALPTPRQQNRIRMTAEYFLKRRNDHATDCHIHIVLLTGWFNWRVFTL